jgi:uncharacterized protein (TIGR03435 family)
MTMGQRTSIAKKIFLTALAGFALMVSHSPTAWAQQAGTGEKESLRFGAASVKLALNAPLDASKGPVRSPFHGFTYTPGRVECVLPLRSLIREAYSIEPWELSGPAWLDQDFYDLKAVMPAQTNRSDARLMLRALLKERFDLRLHLEQRVLTVYELVVDKKGFALKSDPSSPSSQYSYHTGNGSFSAARMPFSGFAFVLAKIIDQPVVDRTGIEGRYTFELKWTLEDSTDGHPAGRPDSGLLYAMRQQLGLRLEPRKGPHPIWVVDHVEKVPTPN